MTHLTSQIIHCLTNDHISPPRFTASPMTTPHLPHRPHPPHPSCPHTDTHKLEAGHSIRVVHFSPLETDQQLLAIPVSPPSLPPPPPLHPTPYPSCPHTDTHKLEAGHSIRVVHFSPLETDQQLLAMPVSPPSLLPPPPLHPTPYPSCPHTDTHKLEAGHSIRVVHFSPLETDQQLLAIPVSPTSLPPPLHPTPHPPCPHTDTHKLEAGHSIRVVHFAPLETDQQLLAMPVSPPSLPPPPPLHPTPHPSCPHTDTHKLEAGHSIRVVHFSPLETDQQLLAMPVSPPSLPPPPPLHPTPHPSCPHTDTHKLEAGHSIRVVHFSPLETDQQLLAMPLSVDQLRLNLPLVWAHEARQHAHVCTLYTRAHMHAHKRQHVHMHERRTVHMCSTTAVCYFLKPN